MTINIPSHLQTVIDSEVMTLCTCWKVTLQSGTILGYTDHDSDLVISGVTYIAKTGYTPSQYIVSAQLNVDNMELHGILDSSTINPADLSAGLWDYADIQIFLTDYLTPSGGIIKIMKGTLGNVTADRNSFVAELRGMMQPLQNQFGKLYTPSCRARLGDAECTVNLTPFTFAATVSTVSSNSVFTSTTLTQADDYFNNGIVVWTSGLNAGITMEVKKFVHTTHTVSLQLGMPYAIEIGDGFNIIAGCNKTTDSCINKFNNILNFRGEPFVPGNDQLTKGIVQ